MWVKMKRLPLILILKDVVNANIMTTNSKEGDSLVVVVITPKG